MAETMALCVGCKACKSECPMSIDMAKMKTEVQAARFETRGTSFRDRLIAHLPRIAPMAAKMRLLANLPGAFPSLLERVAGLSAKRQLPRFNAPFSGPSDGDVLLFADTFNRYFDPETLAAAKRVIEKSGHSVGVVSAPGQPLCCGRTYLSTGMKDKAITELRRTTNAFRQALDAGKTIVGLEPSCSVTKPSICCLTGLREWAKEF
jgi:Fe-S oxidoreductase